MCRNNLIACSITYNEIGHELKSRKKVPGAIGTSFLQVTKANDCVMYKYKTGRIFVIKACRNVEFY